MFFVFDYFFKNKSNPPRQRLAGGKHVGYSESVYRSERKTADRNFALAYFMNEKSGRGNITQNWELIWVGRTLFKIGIYYL